MTQEQVDRINFLREKGNAKEDKDYKELGQIHTDLGCQPRYSGSRCGSCIRKCFINLDKLIEKFNLEKLKNEE